MASTFGKASEAWKPGKKKPEQRIEDNMAAIMVLLLATAALFGLAAVLFFVWLILRT